MRIFAHCASRGNGCTVGAVFEVKKEIPVYCFTVDGNIKYIGKSADNFGKRINQGYGRIHQSKR